MIYYKKKSGFVAITKYILLLLLVYTVILKTLFFNVIEQQELMHADEVSALQVIIATESAARKAQTEALDAQEAKLKIVEAEFKRLKDTFENFLEVSGEKGR